MMIIFFVLFVFIHNVPFTLSSDGDRSPFYQNCVKSCLTANCTEDGAQFTPEAEQLQDPWSHHLMWSCLEDCRYHCMWRTVTLFNERGYQVPKFHGKWPFMRIYGVQEPAAAFCSILNLLSHAYMWLKILLDDRFAFGDTPMMMFWFWFSVVCMHAWTWSAIFHTRDLPYTEFMDYACALSMVTALFVAAVVRIFNKRRKTRAAILTFVLLHFIEHVSYLYQGVIDYEYNMNVNVCFGVIGSLLWLGWSLSHWARAGPAGRYVWRLVLFNKLSAAALVLELFDFPPLLRAWDAHALWHLATAPLPLLFYKFVIDDLDYLTTVNAMERKISEKTDYKLA